MWDSLRSDPLLVSVLVGAFLVRLLLADWNSYWLDELYSVAIYGVWNDSAAEAVRLLAETSVHPPLYQFTLFHWMSWFGDSELATRTLSNLYVTFAALFLYLAVRESFSRRLALASAIAFSLMNATMQFGLETRSYAQTMFLATLSSYLLLRIMRTSVDRGWRGSLISPMGAGLVLTNSALLLTHFYNAFFLVAQGVMALVFVLRVLSPRRWPHGAATLTALYGIPGLVFAGIWGRQFVDTFGRMAGTYTVGEATQLRSPIDLLVDTMRGNLYAPRGLMWPGLIVATVVVGGALVVIAKSSVLDAERQRAWSTAYLVGWLLLPLTVNYVVFSVMGVARYSPRYFLYSVVALVPLTLLMVEETWGMAGRTFGYARRLVADDRWLSSVLTLVIVLVFLPGTLGVGVARKTDFRGAARSIVAIVESNPEASYVILEPAFRHTPVIDYYLDRYSDTVRASGTIRRSQERAGGPFSFELDPDLVAGHDYLILPFLHHRVLDFPLALERLQSVYPVHLWEIGRDGQGLVIFRVADGG